MSIICIIWVILLICILAQPVGPPPGRSPRPPGDGGANSGGGAGVPGVGGGRLLVEDDGLRSPVVREDPRDGAGRLAGAAGGGNCADRSIFHSGTQLRDSVC